MINKNLRGFYPYSWMDLRSEDSSIDMVKLSPDVISLTKLDDLTDNFIPEMDRLVIDYQNSKLNAKMKKVDKMKVENYLSQKNQIEKDDLTSLEKCGLAFQPTTNKGKMIKLMEVLKSLHLAMKKEPALVIALKLMEETFKSQLDDKEIKDKYSRHLDWLKKVVNETDMIEYQLVTKHEMLPPLNEKGFNKLDDWQVDTIKRMRNNESLILSVPTSAGKTYLSAYLTKLGSVLFIAPSVPLARQVAAYLTRVTGTSVPFMTNNYQNKYYHPEMVELLKKSKYIVSTPQSYLDYLPELGTFKQENPSLVLDEIHMMGSDEGDAMETIAILNSNIRFLGLSATISNPMDLIDWRKKMGESLKVISSNKRFFNLQVCYWNNETKEIRNINPIALLSFDEIMDESILKKEMKPTSPDVYQLYQVMKKEFKDLGELEISNVFKTNKIERIDLNQVLAYYSELIKFLVKNKSSPKVKNVLEEFTKVRIPEEDVNLLDLTLELKKQDGLPVLIFQRNTYSMMRMAKKFLAEINQREDEENPDALKEHYKLEKEAKRRQKEMEKLGLLKEDDKDEKKNKMMEQMKISEIIVEHHQKPTEKYQFSNSILSEFEVLEYEKELRKYFEPTGDYMHPIIHALWRGIGIFAEGLPDEYLVIVQSLANQKKLGIVLSDKSMTFGVSMPFRNVVIARDLAIPDDLNPLLFKQMEGRAGRRGQDTKGSVIFAGYTFDRIKELSISMIPEVEGRESIENIYLPIGEKLANVCENHLDFKKVFDYNLYSQKEKIIYSEEESKIQWEEMIKLWEVWTPKAMKGDKELLKMLWQSRTYGCDGVVFYHLVDMMEKYFDGGDIGEPRQEEAGHILTFFLQNTLKEESEKALDYPPEYESKWKEIHQRLKEMGIPLKDEKNLDDKIYKSIMEKRLIPCKDDRDFERLRTRFIKFVNSLKVVQNYCYYSNRITLTRILGKLFTRCKWILWSSSPLTNF
jgi:superfamily II helicase